MVLKMQAGWDKSCCSMVPCQSDPDPCTSAVLPPFATTPQPIIGRQPFWGELAPSLTCARSAGCGGADRAFHAQHLASAIRYVWQRGGAGWRQVHDVRHHPTPNPLTTVRRLPHSCVGS